MTVRLIRSLVAALLALGVNQPAFAQSSVAGPITSNTTWSTTGSPYNVTADVTISNGATLTMQPGVVVRFAAGTSLTVSVGALDARGSSTNGIVFTSARDVSGNTAAAGDWSGIRFLDGTVDAATRLDHVEVRFGRGIQITSASPSLSNVQFSANEGPAIALDLESSPVGRGLRASGNTVNGILVPAGAIQGSVRWGLVGIPYVVAEGEVAVGLPPVQLLPATARVNVGATVSLRAVIDRAAPAGGTTLTLASAQPANATVPPTVTVPAGASEVSFSVTGVAPGTASIMATRGTLGSSTSVVTVAPPISIGLTPPTSRVTRGGSVNLTLTLGEPAAAGDARINLVSSNASVASVATSVTVPAGQTTAMVAVSAPAVGDATITASAPGYTTATAQLTVTDAELSFPRGAIVPPGQTRNLVLVLSEPAPATGLTVRLASDNASATVPATIALPGGATSAAVPVSGGTTGVAIVSASADGYRGASLPVWVDDVSLEFGPQPPPAELSRGIGVSVGVRLSKPRPPDFPFDVFIASSSPALATVSPATLTLIGIGSTIPSGSFTVTGVSAGSVTISATAPALAAVTFTAPVREPPELRFSQATATLGAGYSSTSIRIQRWRDGALDPAATSLNVALTSSNTALATASTSVTIPANSADVTFTLRGFATTTMPVQVSAAASGYAHLDPLRVVVAAPTIALEGLESSRQVGSARDAFQVRLVGVAAADAPPQTLSSATAVDIAIVGASPANLVDGVFSSATSTNAITAVLVVGNSTPTAFVGSPRRTGTYRIRASITGPGGPVTDSDVVTVTPAYAVSFRNFGSETFSVGAGFRRRIGIDLTTGSGGRAFPSEPVVIALSSSDPARARVSASVTFGPPHSAQFVEIDGLQTTSAPVTIVATSQEITAEARLNVDVITPRLFAPLQQTIGVDGPRVEFSELLWVNDNERLLSDMVPLTERTYGLAIVNVAPAGIVDGIWDAATGGTTVTTAIQPALSPTFIPPRFLGSANAPGTFQVRVTPSGEAATTTNITVLGRSLSSPVQQSLIGAGMQGDVLVIRQNGGVDAFDNTALTVNLSCVSTAVCSVPAQVTIPAGEANVSVPVIGISPGQTELRADAAGHGEPLTVPIEVVTPSLRFGFVPPGTPGANLDIQLEIGDANGDFIGVPVNPVTVTLTTGDPAVAQLPATAIISPATARISKEGPFNAFVFVRLDYIGVGTTTLGATAPGHTAASASVTVDP